MMNRIEEGTLVAGKCVFMNEDEQALVVRYIDIIQMKPIKEIKTFGELFNDIP